jgi:cytochrome c5
MRALSIVVAVLLAGIGAAPSIRFDRTTHDFGTIRSDAKQAITWAFHNDGTAPLEIIAMNPSCGCTMGVADPKTVPPGGSGALAVSYDPSGQSGDVRKSLTVVTNDPVHPNTILTIRAKVIADEPAPQPGGHPRFTGQSLLMGTCAGCHAAPAQGKTGGPLWDAVCAMCHGKTGEGLGAFVLSHDDAALTQAITYGTVNPKMPGFSTLMGGPLDDAQVASLAALLRQRAPTPPKR